MKKLNLNETVIIRALLQNPKKSKCDGCSFEAVPEMAITGRSICAFKESEDFSGCYIDHPEGGRQMVLKEISPLYQDLQQIGLRRNYGYQDSDNGREKYHTSTTLEINIVLTPEQEKLFKDLGYYTVIITK